jgi:hypothetical protein
MMASKVRTVFSVCAVEKVFPPTYTTAGVKDKKPLVGYKHKTPAPIKCSLTLIVAEN